MNRKIIITLIIIFLIILAGIIAFSQFGTKSDSQISFLSNASLKNGQTIEFQLTDAQGNAIANQNLTISFGANGTYDQYSVVTDDSGKGGLLLNNEDPGNYEITVNYAGSEQYNGCKASQNMTVLVSETYEEGDLVPSEGSQNYANDGTQEQTYQSQESAGTTYDSELNVYYDSNGKVVGGQNDGADYSELKNNPPAVDQEGNLV